MQLSEINVYPIKSLKGISLNTVKVEKRGLRLDRRWMLIDEKDSFLTQREFPKMAAIEINLLKNGMTASFNGFEDVYFTFDAAQNGKIIKVRVFQSLCDAVVCDNEINNWFSEALRTNCRLVYMPDQSRRAINPLFNRNDDIVSFADGYPFLIIGESSLNDLNSRLEIEVPMNRFRPNFVVRDSAAFAEDNWKKLSIGDTLFRAAKPCARCVITTIDQQHGFFKGKEPLKTLSKYRLAKDIYPSDFQSLGLNKNAILFGRYLVAESIGGTLKIGDEVKILA